MALAIAAFRRAGPRIVAACGTPIWLTRSLSFSSSASLSSVFRSRFGFGFESAFGSGSGFGYGSGFGSGSGSRSVAFRFRALAPAPVPHRCWFSAVPVTTKWNDQRAVDHKRSLDDPEGFWHEQAQKLFWFRQYDRVLDSRSAPFYRWFSGGEFNICYNALDRHISEGNGSKIAMIYDSPVTDTIMHFTYSELLYAVSRTAGALSDLGVGAGDTVLLYMPMIPEAIVSMLACARIGAVHSVVFGGFAANELAVRLNDCKPKVIISASCGVENKHKVVPYKPILDHALEMVAPAHQPKHCLIVQRPAVKATMRADRDLDFHDVVVRSSPVGCLPLPSTAPLYILYTSGTTGDPKGILRDHGGYATALRYSMDHVFGLQPRDVFWAASDVGWVVGHSYTCYGPLLNGNTTILYEGKPVGTPDSSAFWRVIASHKVNGLFTAPTAIRSIRREDPNGSVLRQYDLSSLRTLYLAGERCDPSTFMWAAQHLRIPVIDNFWQTETGWPILSAPVPHEGSAAQSSGKGGPNSSGPVAPSLQLLKPGSCGRAVPGYSVHILKERFDDDELAVSEEMEDELERENHEHEVEAASSGNAGLNASSSLSSNASSAASGISSSSTAVYSASSSTVSTSTTSTAATGGSDSAVVESGSVRGTSTAASKRAPPPILESAKPGELGAIAIRLPLPPGTLLSLYNHDQRYVESYLSAYPGYYFTGDAGLIDNDEYIHVMSRIDDVINVAGHRLSTGAMEEVISHHAEISECAVFGMEDALKGQVPCAVVLLKKATLESGTQDLDTIRARIEKEVVSLVRDMIGPVAAMKRAIVVTQLPKTRSGKILRGLMKKMADGHVVTRIPPTLEDRTSLDAVVAAMRAAGLPVKDLPPH